MELLTFSLADFEGPLDLLLALIAKNKMNIYDIRIMELIDQYLAVVNAGKSGGIETASEFIEMAARLIYMKSVFLLPRNEEQERLKEELTGQLIEYSACKKVAKKLGERSRQVFYAVRRPVELPPDLTYRLHHSPELLRQAILAVKGRVSVKREVRQEQFEPLVSAPVVSVSSRIIHLLRNLVGGKIRQLRGFFSRQASRSETVATFLAVLELMRAGRVTMDDEENLHLNRERRSVSSAEISAEISE